MARRSDHTREELKKLMIRSAKEIIAEKGLMGLTAREIAGKIGYSAGTIYNVFSNLNEIIYHLEIEVLESLESFLETLSDELQPDEQLLLFTEKYLDYIDGYFNSWQLLIEHKAPHDMQIPGWYREKFERIISLVELRMKPLFSAEDISGVERAARVFWAGLHGIIILSGSDKLAIADNENRKDYALFWVKTFTDGLKKSRDELSGAGNISEDEGERPATGS
ncbi:MAG: TetR/AcrR family transcriptional regulator [Methyloligellaceae bacterium]